MVTLRVHEDELHVHDLEGGFLCKHAVAESKGKTVINTDHRRDKTLKVKALLQQTASLFANPEMALLYFDMIRKEKSRYLRDQVLSIRKAIEGKNRQLVAAVLQKCIDNHYASAVMFRELLALQEAEYNAPAPSIGKVVLLDPNSAKKAEIKPDKSDLSAYEKAFGSH
jgi:hypothetical protein